MNSAVLRLGFLLLGLLLVGVLTLQWVLPGSEPMTREWPEAARLDSLRPYLQPVGELPVWLEREEGERGTSEGTVGRRSPWREPPPPPARREPVVTQAPRWTLSAIVTVRDQRVAVIDQRRVGVGDHLPGGAQVEEIHPREVILREPGGTRRVLRLPT